MADSEPERVAASAAGPAFEERQSMPSWFGPALVALSVPALVITVVVFVDAEGVSAESIALIGLSALLVLGPIPLFARAALRTTVDENGVAFRFAPIHRSDRFVPFDEIEEVRLSERRAYQYGVRRTRWGWEYRPNSSAGVELYRETGPALFLGSSRPHELRTAIEAGLRRVERDGR